MGLTPHESSWGLLETWWCFHTQWPRRRLSECRIGMSGESARKKCKISVLYNAVARQPEATQDIPTRGGNGACAHTEAR